MDFDQLCNKFLKSSEKIRFVGIINPSGNLILQKNRKDTTSLLSDDETNMLIHYSFSRWKRLENIEYKLGKITETVTKFEKVSTIMLFYNQNLFLISTDPKSNNSKIISDLWRIIDGKPARTSASKKKTAARKPARTSASKKKTAARKPARTSASKKKTAARKPARTSASKKKTAARKPARTSASKKKTAARKPARTSASKKKTAARKPARTSASKKKTAARKPARTSASKKKTAASISKDYASPELKSKLDQLEEYANSLYQKIRK